jgi:CheY-like chemotaxis protein
MEANVRVLIVEDDQTFCQFLKEMLEANGMDVVSSTNGREGYEKALSDRFDIFILDVRMPGLTGTELANLIKKKNPHANIVLISAFAEAALHETASSLGSPLLSKPFSSEELFQVLKRMPASGGVQHSGP